MNTTAGWSHAEKQALISGTANLCKPELNPGLRPKPQYQHPKLVLVITPVTLLLMLSPQSDDDGDRDQRPGWKTVRCVWLMYSSYCRRIRTHTQHAFIPNTAFLFSFFKSLKMCFREIHSFWSRYTQNGECKWMLRDKYKHNLSGFVWFFFSFFLLSFSNGRAE